MFATITTPPGEVFLHGYHSYLALARTRWAFDDASGARSVLNPLLLAARKNGWCDAEREVSALLADLADETSPPLRGSAASAPPDPAR